MKMFRKLLLILTVILIVLAILPPPVPDTAMVEDWVQYRYIFPTPIRTWDFENGYVISCWVPPLQVILVNHTMCSNFIARRAETLFCSGYILQYC